MQTYRIVAVWDCTTSVITIIRHYKLQRKFLFWWFTIKIVATEDHAIRWFKWSLQKRKVKSKRTVVKPTCKDIEAIKYYDLSTPP